MILRRFLGVGLLLVTCSCTERAQPDPLGPRENAVIYRVVQCTAPQPDGSCNKMSCKKDEKSDCTAFVRACLKNKHTANGTSSEATCTRNQPAPA